MNEKPVYECGVDKTLAKGFEKVLLRPKGQCRMLLNHLFVNRFQLAHEEHRCEDHGQEVVERGKEKFRTETRKNASKNE